LRLLEREEAGLAELRSSLMQGLAQAENDELVDGTDSDAIRRAFDRARSLAWNDHFASGDAQKTVWSISRDEGVSQSCAVLLDDEADLRYARAGDHFVVLLECATEVLIVDFLHSHSDLPRQIAAWGHSRTTSRTRA